MEKQGFEAAALEGLWIVSFQKEYKKLEVYVYVECTEMYIYFWKIADEKVGCVFAYFWGEYKNSFCL